MLDLTAELRDLIDAFQRLDVEFTIAGPLANALHHGEGIQQNLDLVVWPEDRDVAESGAVRLGFQRAGRPRPAAGGRYNIQRLIKANEADILKLNLIVPSSLVTAVLLGDCATRAWQGRTVRIAGWASIDAVRRATRESPRYLALCLLQLFSPDAETWGERDLLPRFDVLVATPQAATPDDIEALLVGFRQRCWAGKPSREILQMAYGLPANLIEQSPALAAYVRAIQVASAPRQRFRCNFLNTLAGLRWA